MSGCRFLHVADIHLDVPFSGISADNELVGGALAESTFAAFMRVIDTAIRREVDFVVIAGDSYNSSDHSLRAERAFQKGMERLDEADIPVFVALGNHDPADSRHVGLKLPGNVHVFRTDAVERVEVGGSDTGVAVYGRSYARFDIRENLSLGYKRDAADRVAIGVLHANVGGDSRYEPYSPCSLDDLRAGGMDYWALGHIHKHEVLAETPRVVYPGSPQGLNPKEIGRHGCCVVEMDESGVTAFDYVDTAEIDWVAGSVDVSGAADIDDVLEAVSSACDDARDGGRPVVARFEIEGRTAAHGALRRPGVLDAILEDLRDEQMGRSPWVWVDRISVGTASPLDLESIAKGEDFAAVLAGIASTMSEAEVLEILGEIAAPLGKTLRGYESTIAPADALAAARDACLDQLLAEGGAR